jgi:hypothetical protein
MALQDKLRARVTPHLQPGEQVQAVVPCQTGPSPNYMFLTTLMIFWSKYWLIAATDQNLVVFRMTKLSMKPKEVVRRLPRSTRFGPLSGLWGRNEVLGEKTFVHRRFHKIAALADSLAGAAPAVAAGWYPDPNEPGTQRYWDGMTWTEHTAPA